MATVTRLSSAQSLSIAKILMDEGDRAVINLHSPRQARVDWDDGGVSWTIAGSSVSVEVDHSLMPAGNDADDDWVPDALSPFQGGSDGNEHYRIQRIRFHAKKGTPTVIVSSNAKFEVAVY